jgi:hypothetical protein
VMDRYTKAVLTVIAGALVALVVQNGPRPANAQVTGLACGETAHACHIVLDNLIDPCGLHAKFPCFFKQE